MSTTREDKDAFIVSAFDGRGRMTVARRYRRDEVPTALASIVSMRHDGREVRVAVLPRDEALAITVTDAEKLGRALRTRPKRNLYPRAHERATARLAWEVQRLARQVAELAQRLDGDT